jgi:ketosteroid isomerase-like protein
MKNIFTAIALTLSYIAAAQQYQQEINEQVWRPFIQTFNNFDTEGFMAVHSKDLVRAPLDAKAIMNFDQYKKQNEAGNQQARLANQKRSIELRFLNRVASESQAYEVGVYKTTMTTPDGGSRHYYGKFQVVLRKENGTWKILVDSDTSEGRTITEKDFQEAKPL